VTSAVTGAGAARAVDDRQACPASAPTTAGVVGTTG